MSKDKPMTYQLTGGDVSPEWDDVYINCPHCEYATRLIDLPRGNCEHCSKEITVSVIGHEADGSDSRTEPEGSE